MDRVPVACSLTARQFADRGLAWRALIDGWLRVRMRTPAGVRLVLRDEPGVCAAANELMNLEAECCPWMDMVLARKKDSLVLDITGQDATAAEALAGIFTVDGAVTSSG